MEVVSNNYSSAVGMLVGAMITVHVQQHRIGIVTGADSGYMIGNERYIPDVAFISHARQPKPSHDAYNPTPPDLAVEVLSLTNDDEKLRVKVTNYMAAGVVVWVVDPDRKTVEVYQAGHPVTILQEPDVLDGGDILPGFQLAVGSIFPPEDAA